MNRVGLARGGIVVDGRVVPLFSGSVHYWRLERGIWKEALLATKRLGVSLIDTYVPWGVHEMAEGETDFGANDARLDVVAFLRLVHELGLLAIVRPGPHVNAELTYFGIPERIIWDAACQARSPQGNPVMLPMAPVGFPVPSYASTAFLAEADNGWQCGRAARAPGFPRGPSCFARSTTRVRSTSATVSTTRTTGPKRFRFIAHFCEEIRHRSRARARLRAAGRSIR